MITVVYLDSVQARLASLRELQSATGEELRRTWTLISANLEKLLELNFKRSQIQ